MKQSTTIFEPRQIDKYAREVSPGMVKIDGIDELVPLTTYLSNKSENLQYLTYREGILYREVKNIIKSSLPLRSGQWQEECRRLSWAYSSGLYSNSYLSKLTDVCPGLPLMKPDDSTVSAHHLSHFIKAYFAVIMKLEPVSFGRSENILSIAESEEDALQARITVWEYLLSVKPQGIVPTTKTKNNTLEDLLKDVRTLLDHTRKIIDLLEVKKPPKPKKGRAAKDAK